MNNQIKRVASNKSADKSDVREQKRQVSSPSPNQTVERSTSLTAYERECILRSLSSHRGSRPTRRLTSKESLINDVLLESDYEDYTLLTLLNSYVQKHTGNQLLDRKQFDNLKEQLNIHTSEDYTRVCDALRNNADIFNLEKPNKEEFMQKLNSRNVERSIHPKSEVMSKDEDYYEWNPSLEMNTMLKTLSNMKGQRPTSKITKNSSSTKEVIDETDYENAKLVWLIRKYLMENQPSSSEEERPIPQTAAEFEEQDQSATNRKSGKMCCRRFIYCMKRFFCCAPSSKHHHRSSSIRTIERYSFANNHKDTGAIKVVRSIDNKFTEEDMEVLKQRELKRASNVSFLKNSINPTEVVDKKNPSVQSIDNKRKKKQRVSTVVKKKIKKRKKSDVEVS